MASGLTSGRELTEDPEAPTGGRASPMSTSRGSAAPQEDSSRDARARAKSQPLGYPKNRYKSDCCMVLSIKKNIEKFPLASLITLSDVMTAVGVWRLESASRKRALFTEVQEELRSPQSPTKSEDQMRAFLSRFRRGPSNADDVLMADEIQGLDELDPETQTSPGLRPGFGQNLASVLESTSAGNNDLMEVLQRLQTLERQAGQHRRTPSSAQEERGGNAGNGRHGATTRPPLHERGNTAPMMSGGLGRSRSDEPNQGTRSEARAGHSTYPATLSSVPPLADRPMNSAPYPTTYPRQDDEERSTKIRPNDLMIFDPTETKVSFFVRRCQQIATLEGEKAVLRVLPLCLKGEALVVHVLVGSPETGHEPEPSDVGVPAAPTISTQSLRRIERGRTTSFPFFQGGQSPPQSLLYEESEFVGGCQGNRPRHDSPAFTCRIGPPISLGMRVSRTGKYCRRIHPVGTIPRGRCETSLGGYPETRSHG